jgi:large subunit ribosomal protein L9
MKVLLIQDVYKLGRAGDVKKVANGYGRNYLIPQGLAVLATPGAMKQAEQIRTRANAKRALLNEEMSGVAEVLADLTLTFPVKAGETGKLYGSITQAMITDAIQEKTGVELNRRQLDLQPIRNLGVHNVDIRLTIDLIPTITVVVYREGETAEMMIAELAEAEAEAEAGAEAEAEFVAETEPDAEAAPEPPAEEEAEEAEPAEEAEATEEAEEAEEA